MRQTQPPRWLRRTRRPALTATALAALFAATACGSDAGPGTPAGADETTSSTTADTSTTDTSTTETTTETTTSTTRRTSTTSSSVRSSTTSSTVAATSTTTGPNGNCSTQPDGQTVCAIDGRPLRRRGRLLLPLGNHDRQARTEYASVASFGELALRLIAVGAPVELVEACHRAALDEIRHARTVEAGARFGAIPALLGRRVGGWARSRRAQLERIAVESFLDGWLNESAAAEALQSRADAAAPDEERAALAQMAEDERGHAALAKQIVEWCFAEEPDAVGRALAKLAA